MAGFAIHFKNSRRVMEKRNKIKPQWLELLLKKRFFGVCVDHKEIRKSEINIYCIECDLSMCSHCIVQDLSHRFHKMIQIRRYVYQDVVRIQDMQKLVDCSKVQSYTVNSAKVLLLNARKQSKLSKVPPGSIACKVCHRIVMEPNRYCSIACKVSDESSLEIVTSKEKSKPLITPPMDLEDLSSKENESTSSLLSQLSDPVEKNCDCSMMGEGNLVINPKGRVSRRKGVPHRSPIF